MCLVGRFCGREELDRLPLLNGCSTVRDIKICRCSTDGCNRYPDIVNVTSTTVRVASTATRTTSTSESTRIVTASPTSIASTIRAASHTTDSVPTNNYWSCYVCVNCGTSLGRVFNCSRISSSKTCITLRNPARQGTCLLLLPQSPNVACRSETSSSFQTCLLL